jgi:hypothetical protein
MQDKLDCPYCGCFYEEEFIEALINSSFKCHQCDCKIRVKLSLDGYILMQRRKDRMNYAKVKEQREEDCIYLDRIKQQYITEVMGMYSDSLSEMFFKCGKCEWVRETRYKFSEDARMLGIPLQTIVYYFKKNGGNIDYRTINSYANDYDE